MRRKTKQGQDLIEGLKEAIAHETKHNTLQTTLIEIPGPPPNFSRKQIIKLRKETFKISQVLFAKLLNVSPGTVRSWEQGDKKPSGATNRLIQILSSNIDVVNNL